MTSSDKQRRLWDWYFGDGETPDPLAFLLAYNFDEGAGDVAAEKLGRTPLTGMPGWGPGRQGMALKCTGAPGPTLDPFAANVPFTLMFDVSAANSGFNMFLAGVAGEIGNIQQGGGGIEWYPWFGPTGVFAPVDTWTNIAVSADGAKRRIAVNGVEVANVNNNELSGTNPFTLGGLDGYNPQLSVDNFRVYDAGISIEDIALRAGAAV